MSNGKNKNKKKTLPIKPNPKSNTTKQIKNVVKAVEPSDVKLAKKMVKDRKFRNKILDGFLTGISFGLYRP